MSKFLLFSLLFWLTGNPLSALFLLIVLLYLADLRFTRLLPNLFTPIKLGRQLAKAKQTLRLNPHDTSAKLEVARILMEKGRYQEALPYLQGIQQLMSDSAEYASDYGICLLKTGEIEKGEEWINKALQLNPRVKYGEPYLYLSEAYLREDKSKALSFLKELKELHSSSAQLYYRMGRIYQELQRRDEAKSAYREAIEVYRGLPRYKKRLERRWAVLARFRLWGL